MRSFPPRGARQRWYPWVVIAVSFLTVGAAFGARGAFAVFLIAVVEEFHWSRGLASGAIMVGAILWTLAAPPIGMLLDRYGPRPVLACGALIMAAGFVVSGLARGALEFYLGMGVLVGIGFGPLTMTSHATFLSNWFVRRRGMAIGAAAAGVGIGILAVVPLTQRLIAAYGWRNAYFILAAVLALGVAPLSYFFQRRSPQEMGLQPDFGEVSGGTGRHNAIVAGPTLREALKTWRFWIFSAGVLAGAIPLHLVLIHQVAAVNDAGFSREVAALALGAIGLFTAPAMVIMGFIADRIGSRLAYLLGSASLIAGMLLLMLLPHAAGASRTWLLYGFPPFIAFGFSSRQSLYPTMAADLFHGKSFGAIIGAVALFIGAGGGLGPWLGGVLHDRSGNYDGALALAAALALASIGFIWIAGAQRPHR
ncbi:MAG TPA: MFS transporter [Candidatus Binatia bacterium]|nr:MFS transporter [Candidatus Binatia bacterium]